MVGVTSVTAIVFFLANRHHSELSPEELAAAAHTADAGFLTLSGNLVDLVHQGLLAYSQEECDDSAEDPAPIDDVSPEHLTLREREVLEIVPSAARSGFFRDGTTYEHNLVTEQAGHHAGKHA